MKKNQRKQVEAAKPKPAVANKTKAPAFPWWNSRPFLYTFLAITLLFVAFVRYRLLELPLERDEGEYALMGQLILKGIAPYEAAYNMKLPGTYYMYALLMSIFGQSAAGVHAGLLLVNLTTIVLLFFIGKKMINGLTGLCAAASYALMSILPGPLAFAGHATHYNALFAAGGLLALVSHKERPTLWRLIVSGLCFGLSFTMKQQALFWMPFAFLALGWMEWQRHPRKLTQTLLRLGILSVAMVLPYLLVLLLIWSSGTMDKFWHWTVAYAQQYAGIVTWEAAWNDFQQSFTRVREGVVALWLAGLLGLVALFFSESARKFRWEMLGFVVFSIACVLPGFYFRPHYFILFFPALALLIGVAVNFLRELLQKTQMAWLGFAPFILFVFLWSNGVSTHRKYLFTESPNAICSKRYGTSNPFIESREIGKFLKANSSEQDKIAVIGSEPQIYFYASRIPATGYIYTYPLMENQPYSLDMQKDMIAEIEKNQPKYMIFINSPMSWLRKDTSAKDIFSWYEEYKKKYKVIGLVDMLPTGKANYIWGEQADTYTPQSQNRVWIFERN